MASLSTDVGGNRRILFVGPDGTRRTIRIGKLPKRTAEQIKLRVEHLLAAKLSGHAPDPETARWLAELDSTLADKLARLGLAAPRENTAGATLGAFLVTYIASRTDVKSSTVRHLTDCANHLREYLGSAKPLRDISPGDADEFRRYLAARLGENTVRRICGRAKQFFRAALRKRLIAENPFGDMTNVAVKANRSRDYFLTRADAAKILAACPDAEWRLIFALSRFGGLRCPSEHLSLTWDCVDWERGRLRVPSPKTEHHEGGAERWLPLFPELREHLEAVFDAAPEGATHVVTRYHDARQNLRTQFERIIRRAGLEPWPKLFANLRASRATELAAEHPAHVAAAWLGHSTIVANKHYWQVTDADFERATTSGAQAAHNAAQYVHEWPRTATQAEGPAHEKTPGRQGLATSCGIVHNCLVPPDGLEPSTL